MVDGAASLMTMIHAFHRHGLWNDDRGANMLDTGAPFYEVYETSDGKWMAVGGIEAQFYAELLKGLGLEGDASVPHQMARDDWPAMKERFTEIFKSKTREEWTKIFDGTDACVAPVLSPWEAHLHPHNVARSTFVEVEGRYSRPQRPASRGRRRPSPRRRRLRAPTRSRDWSSGGSPRRSWRSCADRERSASRRVRQILTTGQVMVRVMPSICWRSRTTMRPRSFMEGASARAMTS